MYPFDALWDDTGEVSAARAAKHLQDHMLSTYPARPDVGLTNTDVQRIAEAVVDEQERRAAHPLRVTADDVRRWIR